MMYARHFILVKLLLLIAAVAMFGWLWGNLQSREAALHNDARMQEFFTQERRALVGQILNSRAQDEPLLRFSRLSRTLPDAEIEGLPRFIDRNTFKSWLAWDPQAQMTIAPRLLDLLHQDDNFYSGMPKRYAALVEIWREGAQGLPESAFERLYVVASDFWHGRAIGNDDYRFLLKRLPQEMYDIFCDQLLMLGSYPPYPDSNWLYLEKENRAFLLQLPDSELNRLNADIASLRIGISLIRSESWHYWGSLRANLVPFYLPLSDQLRNVRLVHLGIGLLVGLTLFAIYLVINRYEKVYVLQKQLLAATSHELRTPVAVMRQFAEMLQERSDQFQPRIQKYHNFIHREAMRMQFLVENLLSAAKFENLKLELNVTMLDLATWLQEWTEAADILHDHCNISCDVPEAISVNWDSTLMSQVVTNLIDNAQKHAGTDIHIKAEDRGEQVELTFRDFGTQINWSRLRRIRAFMGISKPDKGLGLGLYLVQQIVRRHHGSLTFDEADPGLCVRLIIPKNL